MCSVAMDDIDVAVVVQNDVEIEPEDVWDSAHECSPVC